MSRAHAGAGRSSRSAAALETVVPTRRVSHSRPSIPHRSFHHTRTQPEKTGPRRREQSRRVTEHVGSTSVPDLPAKPIIDILLVVADSANEMEYATALEGVGYKLHVREPGWHEHRMFTGPESDINLNVFSVGCPEVARMLAFRDWLRTNEADRELYARCKRTLAQQEWKYTQNYADAKTSVIEEIMSRARGHAHIVGE